MENTEFDKSTFSKNLGYLLKRSGMTIGQLESAIGISAGYISRTVNPDSDKKLSIDAMWKISRLFNVGIDDLISRDLAEGSLTNSDMAVSFIEKLNADTLSDRITWRGRGGYSTELSAELQSAGFGYDQFFGKSFRPGTEGSLVHIISNDIYSCDNAGVGSILMIAPYTVHNDDRVHYYFLLVPSGDSAAGGGMEELFDTADPTDTSLDECAGILYRTIKNRCSDLRLGKGAKSFIQAYMGR